MAQRILPFTVETGTQYTPTAPLTTDLTFPSADVIQVDIMVPPGPSGFLGFYLGNGGGQVIPEGIGQWITPDDVYLSFQMEGLPNNGNWQFVSYNTGNYSHTVYLYLHVNNLNQVQGASFSTPVSL